MIEYDPAVDPDPAEWLELDEGERITLVEDYHENAGIDVPNLLLHAGFHVTIETQVAMSDELPVRSTLRRLVREGLDRHDAIHAIGSVLAEHMFDILRDKGRRVVILTPGTSQRSKPSRPPAGSKVPANTALQRTRSAPLRSPLNFEPLGRRKLAS